MYVYVKFQPCRVFRLPRLRTKGGYSGNQLNLEGRRKCQACAATATPGLAAPLGLYLPNSLPRPASTCLPVCLSACLPACLHACMPACLHACLSVCLPACLPACLLVTSIVPAAGGDLGDFLNEFFQTALVDDTIMNDNIPMFQNQTPRQADNFSRSCSSYKSATAACWGPISGSLAWRVVLCLLLIIQPGTEGGGLRC